MTLSAAAFHDRRRLPLLALLAWAAALPTACRDAGRRPAAPPTVDAAATAVPAVSVPPADVAPAAPPSLADAASPSLAVQGTPVPPVVATLEACDGDCRLARPETTTPPEGEVGPGTPLYAGDLLESPAAGRTELTLAAGGPRLVLWPGSRLKFGVLRPGDLCLVQGGLAALGAPAAGTEPPYLHTPLGTVGPLGGRFVARIAAGGRGLLFGTPDDGSTAPLPVLADGLGAELPLDRSVLHALGPAALPATSESLAWEPGASVPSADVEQVLAAFEAQAATVAEDERLGVVVALAQGLEPRVEELAASREDNRRLLAELEAANTGGTDERRRAVREELRASARRSVEAERSLWLGWYRLELLIGAAGTGGRAQWALHAARGMERWRGRVEELLGRGGPMEAGGTMGFGGAERP